MWKLTGVSWTSVGTLYSNATKKGTLELVCGSWKMNTCRTMVSKPYRVKKQKPAPFPYEEGKFNMFWAMVDVTIARFDENSKLIVVEGPVCSGKHEVAQKIAEAFEMKYVAPPTMDTMYINAYGYDMRNLDNKIPESLQTYDEKKFNLNPTHFNAAAFQLNMYRMRYNYHIDCLAHILNTGQGVVTVRSPFSDFIWTESMFQNGYLSPNVRNFYYQVVRHSINVLFRPHLVVYLDVPVNKTIDNIKTKGADYEVNSKALTPNFLQTMEKLYKDKYLPEANIPGEVLMVNWAEEDDVEDIISDIERIDFDTERSTKDPKFADWRQDEMWLDIMRLEYTPPMNKERLITLMDVDTNDTPELFANEQDWKVRHAVYEKAPGMEYMPGFNIARGDKGIMWKDVRGRYWDPEG